MRFWVALARFSAKRAGGRFVRTLAINNGPTWSMSELPGTASTSSATRYITVDWRPSE